MLKVGIIGAGMISYMLSEGLSHIDNIVFEYVYNHTKEKAKKLASKYNLTITNTPRELIENSDLVIIAVPTYVHFYYAKMVIEKGKHCFIEKPVTLTLKESYTLRELLKNKDIKFGVGHVVRYFSAYEKLKEIIRNREIGNIVNVKLERLGPSPTWASWFLDEEKSGGIIQDLIIHDLDFIRWIWGKPIAINGLIKDKLYAYIMLELKNNIFAHIEGSWAYPKNYPFNYGFEVTGEKGFVKYNSLDENSFKLFKNSSQSSINISLENPYEKELRDFVNSIIGNKNIGVGIDEAIEALELVSEVKKHITIF